MTHQIYPHIRTPMDLGIAHIGYPGAGVANPENRIDRAEYGRRLAALEGGVFTPQGYMVPTLAVNGGSVKNEQRANCRIYLRRRYVA